MKSIRKEEVSPSEGYYIVGKVQRAHGIRGEIFVYLFAGEAAWLKDLKEISLLLAEKSQSKPENRRLKISSKKFHKDGLILSSPEIADRTQAESLKGAFFEIPEAFLQTNSNTDFYLKEILGFELRLETGSTIGKIVGFEDNSVQDLAQVETSEGVYSVPLVNEWILELNREHRFIKMSLPEGLLGAEFDDTIGEAKDEE